jgi:radical SAM superfamily enzyme YgiQ (UPF0313 family)
MDQEMGGPEDLTHIGSPTRSPPTTPGLGMGSYDVLLIGFEEVENLGLRYLAAFLAREGVSVKIIPCDRLSPDRICDLVLESSPKLVGFSLIFQRMIDEFAHLISSLRDAGIKAHFTMGGHFPTVEPATTLDTIPGLDSVVRCEGEETLRELFEHLGSPHSWRGIRGLAFRENGRVVLTEPRPLIKDLDSLPLPWRQQKVLTHRGVGVCSIVASRGCYNNCSFCSIQRFYAEAAGSKRRSRSPRNVAEEMELLYRELGARVFIFEDDDMVMRGQRQRAWTQQFAAELRRLRLADDIVWRISCRVDDVHADTLVRLMEVGLRCVYIGIESGSDAGLSTYNKHYSVGDVERAIDELRSIGMPFEFGFMLLNPDSTFDMVEEDVLFLKRLGANGDAVVHFTKMVPYAGTPIAERLKAEGRLRGGTVAPDYSDADSRLDLLQLFCTQAFHFRNFNAEGLVERLRHAKFDLTVASKFSLTHEAANQYAHGIRALTRQSNEQCLRTLSMAVDLMSWLSEDQILEHWDIAQNLVREQEESDRQLTNALNDLMSSYQIRSGQSAWHDTSPQKQQLA